MQDRAAEFDDIDAVVDIDDGEQIATLFMLSSLIHCCLISVLEICKLMQHQALQHHDLVCCTTSTHHSPAAVIHDCTIASMHAD